MAVQSGAASNVAAPRILSIEDDTRLARMLSEYLGEAGFVVVHAPDATQGLVLAEKERFDAIVLDVMLPDIDGFEVCRRLRSDDSMARNIPILMLTARGDPTDRIVGLELGADDYLPKPFHARELLARLRAVMRRKIAGSSPDANRRTPLRFGRLEIDRDARVIRRDGEECDLTSYQMAILVLLAENAGRVMSRDQLLDGLRGVALEAFDRSIDVHISRIRAAIEDDPKQPRRIITVRGAGYVFAKIQDA
jgi:two-component system, OmpR family, phosphate regulon response regulator OmpR